jgi:hypothetical protein
MFEVIDSIDQMRNLLMQTFNSLSNGLRIARQRDNEDVAESRTNTPAAPTEWGEL